jgi:hypothetical protein
MRTSLGISVVILFMFLLLSCNKVDPVVPTLLAGDAESITTTSAVVYGTITNDGGAQVIARGVCWNTSGILPTIEDSKTIETDNDSHTVGSNLTQLSPNTKYYFRAYATNSAGTGYSETYFFYTAEN